MIPMFASCTLLWGLMKPHILGVQDSKQNQPQPKKTPDLGIKDKVNIFKVGRSKTPLAKLTFRKRFKNVKMAWISWHQVLSESAMSFIGGCHFHQK